MGEVKERRKENRILTNRLAAGKRSRLAAGVLKGDPDPNELERAYVSILLRLLHRLN
jgi:hypothetical protein